jgi:hypothetical protein
VSRASGLAGHAQATGRVVIEAHHAAAADFVDEAEFTQAIDRVQHLGFAQLHDRIASGFLVAAQGEGVERQRVAVRDGVLFLYQHGKDSGFFGRQRARHGSARYKRQGWAEHIMPPRMRPLLFERGGRVSDRLFVLSQYVLPKHALTALAGVGASARGGALTTRFIRWFVGRYGVNMAEAANPDIASYPTFNEFFSSGL